MRISIPLDKLPNVDASLILKHIQKVSFLRTALYWILDWRVRRQVHLQTWIKNNLDIPIDLTDKLPKSWLKLKPHAQIKEITKFVIKHIKYTSDKQQWKVEEKWSTPTETWTTKKGDCEDGALLIYAIARFLNTIPDYQMYITAGKVEIGGHAYIVFVSERDAMEYPMDWSAWPTTSLRMQTPYLFRKNYYWGTEEWFRFNASGSYKLWRRK